jgi:peroxin-16
MSATSIKEIFAAYKKWVVEHPTLVTDVETLTKWSSYYIAGKINKSSLISELVYTLSNLFVLYNDTLILRAHRDGTFQNTTKEKIKFWLTVVHICEVFVELTAREKYGTKGKWSVASVIQLFNCASNLILLFKYKELAIQHPPIPSLQRGKLMESVGNEDENSEGFTLKRSGRTIRKVDAAPPIPLRSWKPLPTEERLDICKNEKKRLILAEALYTLKPILHLGSIAYFGSAGWKQWLLSLGLDLSSLYLYDKNMKALTFDQRVEINRRKLSLIYYLLRSPMFEKRSKAALTRFLQGTSNKVPLASYICNPILQYMSYWQDTYFYMWAN